MAVAATLKKSKNCHISATVWLIEVMLHFLIKRNYYNTKVESVSISCKSHCFKTGNIKILSTNSKHKASFYIYDRPLTDTNVLASVCTLNLRIQFRYFTLLLSLKGWKQSPNVEGNHLSCIISQQRCRQCSRVSTQSIHHSVPNRHIESMDPLPKVWSVGTRQLCI